MMLKKLLLPFTLLCLILCLASCKHADKPKTEKKIYDPYKDAPGSVVTKTYDNGAKRDVDIYRIDEKGNRTDEVVCHAAYHKNGTLYTEMKFDHGLEDGVWNAYYDDGTPWSTAKYDHGVQIGEEKTFYPNGNVRTQCTYNQGKIDGEYIEYFDSGKKMRSTKFDMGVKNGDEICYYQNGKICYQGHFANGNCIGTWNYYDEIGNITRTAIADENAPVCRNCPKCKALLDAHYAKKSQKSK